MIPEPEDNVPGVTAALQALARDDRENLTPVRDLEPLLQVHVRAIGAVRRRRRQIAALAATAAVIGIVTLTWWRSPVPTSIDTQIAFSADPSPEVATEFLPLNYDSTSREDGQLVRIEVPRAALASFGLNSESPNDAGGVVLADVVVGDDGLARAVRFVRPARN